MTFSWHASASLHESSVHGASLSMKFECNANFGHRETKEKLARKISGREGVILKVNKNDKGAKSFVPRLIALCYSKIHHLYYASWTNRRVLCLNRGD